MLVLFVEGHPVGQVTCDYLAWLADKMAAVGKKAFVLIWDNASWHKSQAVKNWLKSHNRVVKKQGRCRLRVCFLAGPLDCDDSALLRASDKDTPATG